MPRKRNQKHSRLKKQPKITTPKQAFRTRLIELSLRLDDHIYHKNLISESQAEVLITEVNTYKTKCSDAACLQVIEKLTRLLKAIIAEHQELRNNTDITNNDPSFFNMHKALSNMSLTHEDREESMPNQTEYFPDSPTILENFKEIDMPHIKNTSINLMVDKRTSDMEIEIAANPGVERKLYNQNELDKQNSLKTNEDLRNSTEKVPPISVKNTNVKATATPNKKYNLNSDLVAKVSRAISSKFNLDNTVKEVACLKGIVIKEQNINIVNKQKVNEKSPVELTGNLNNVDISLKLVDKISTLGARHEAPKIVPRVSQKKVSASNNDLIIDLSKEDPTTTIKKKRVTRKKNGGEIKTKSEKPKKIRKENTNVRFKCCENDKTTDSKPKKTTNRKKRNTTDIQKDLKIYNRNVADDLSWLESIRFVREIGEDEYDRENKFNDDFWDNYDLPPNFDDGDFI